MINDKIHDQPKYSLEFKQDAAKLVFEKSFSQRQVDQTITLKGNSG